MPIHNAEIAEALEQIADLLEIEGANTFRVRAYRNAAQSVETMSRSLAELVEAGEDLTGIPGVGKDLASKIDEFVTTGTIEQLEVLKARTPPGLAQLLKVAGLGPKRVRTLYEELEITSLEGLRQAAANGAIRELYGFGRKTEQAILEDLERRAGEEQRYLLFRAEHTAEPLVAYLKDGEAIERVTVVGSYRRRKATVGDLDLIASGADHAAVIRHFLAYEDVEDILAHEEHHSAVTFRSGMEVSLWSVPREQYGAALILYTGGDEHRSALRALAREKGLSLDERGLFRGDERVAGPKEEELYAALDLAWIPPELREGRGELEAARAETLPHLVTLEDVRGDLQMHTQASDGRATLEEMARAARELGYAYVAITDHSAYLAVVQGLDAEGLCKRIDEIEALNEQFEDFRILKSIEVDILEDGTLDMPDDVLERLDICVCAVHSHFNLSEEKQTERIVRAMDNPNFNVLAHPTGRRIGERPPYAVDVEQVLRAARERGCYLELNAQPNRLDLNDVHARMAKELGVKLAISTDAHDVTALQRMRFGVDQARRAWLEPEDVLNTRSWEELRELLKR